MEPQAGVEPTIRDLQSLALPLGYRGNELRKEGDFYPLQNLIKAASIYVLPLHQLA